MEKWVEELEKLPSVIEKTGQRFGLVIYKEYDSDIWLMDNKYDWVIAYRHWGKEIFRVRRGFLGDAVKEIVELIKEA